MSARATDTTSETKKKVSLDVRAAVDDDLPAILTLMKASLGEGNIPRDEAFFRWKHIENPFGRSPILLAFSSGTLVGLRAFMRWTWTSEGRAVRAVRAVDTATHPEFQGQGIFKKLTLSLVDEVRADGVSFVFNTPNEKSRPGYLKMGWSDVMRVPLYARVGRPITRRVLARDEAADERADRASLARVLEDPALDDLLSASSTSDERFHTDRTRAFLAWRYRDVPGFTYGARASLAARGACVIFRRRDRGNARECTIEDVICARDPRSIATAGALLWTLALSSGVDYLASSAAPSSREAAALVAGGFVPVGARGPHFTALPLADVTPSPLLASSWRASVGDLELF